MSLAEKSIGRYQMLQLIGRGGMGDVYLAEDPQLQRQVAIKVIQFEEPLYSDSLQIEKASRRFLREARAVAQLDHPYVLPVFDFGQAQIDGNNLTYMVMAFRPEGSFADWLRQRGCLLPWDEVDYFIQQAADALQHAHQRRITHRDIKPSNFLIRSTLDGCLPDLLLTDFGIARFLTETISERHTSRGTPAYMAPEQWRGNAVPASDQYALAVMAYELLTGDQPFHGQLEQVMYQHLHDQPTPPSQLNPHLPVEVDTVLLRALAKTPEERFASIIAFADALSLALQARSACPEPTLTTYPLATALPSPPSGQGARSAAQLLLTTRVSACLVRPKPPERNRLRDTFLLLVALLLTGGSMIGLIAYFNHVSAQIPKHVARTPLATRPITRTSTPPATAVATQTATPPPVDMLSNPYPPYSGKVTVNDPLSDNSKGYNWNDLPGPTYGCAFTNSSYHAFQTASGWFTECFAESPGLTFANFTFQVHMSILSGDCGALVFRAASTEDQSYFFRVCQDGTYDLRMFIDNTNRTARTLINQTANPAIHPGLHVSNLLAVVAQGDQLKLYINQQLVSSITDSSYSAGKVALAASSRNKATEVVFNDALLWQQ